MDYRLGRCEDVHLTFADLLDNAKVRYDLTGQSEVWWVDLEETDLGAEVQKGG